MANSVFPDTKRPPSVGLEASLDSNIVREMSESNGKHGSQFNWFKYWIALDDEVDKVAGVIGIYEEVEDADEACWLGWFCVDPAFRKRGIGTMLLDYAIDQANKLGKRYLRLYTSTDSSEAVAQQVYEKRGFRIMDERPRKSVGEYEIFYRELDLQKS